MSKKKSIKDLEEQHERETEFHDNWADSENIDEVEVKAMFEGLTAMENRFMVKHMGDLRGKRILDVGAGLGESSVYFALQGAKVTYNDISPQMGETAKKLGERFGVSFEYAIGPAEKLVFENEGFDIVYCANLMHHVYPEEHMVWLESIHRFLKPGGRLYTWDPIKYNPVINVYRRMATEVRTIDEMPLGFSILKKYKSVFDRVEHKEFWFTTLWLFLYYYLIKRYNPNKVRYWKRIYREDKSTIGWWFNPLMKLDSLLLRIPGIRHMAWNTVICAYKDK